MYNECIHFYLYTADSPAHCSSANAASASKRHMQSEGEKRRAVKGGNKRTFISNQQWLKRISILNSRMLWQLNPVQTEDLTSKDKEYWNNLPKD